MRGKNEFYWKWTLLISSWSKMKTNLQSGKIPTPIREQNSKYPDQSSRLIRRLLERIHLFEHGDHDNTSSLAKNHLAAVFVRIPNDMELLLLVGYYNVIPILIRNNTNALGIESRTGCYWDIGSIFFCSFTSCCGELELVSIGLRRINTGQTSKAMPVWHVYHHSPSNIRGFHATPYISQSLYRKMKLWWHWTYTQSSHLSTASGSIIECINECSFLILKLAVFGIVFSWFWWSFCRDISDSL